MISTSIFFVVMSWGLISFFIRHDQGPPEPVGAIRSGFLFGLASLGITLVLAIPIDLFLFDGTGINEAAQGIGSVGGIFQIVAVHATIEEFAKFFPLALAIYHRSFFNEVSDGVIYFAIVGVTFGAVENILYAVQGGGSVAFLRVVLGLFFHAGLTALVGYYLAREKMLHKSVIGTVLAFGAATVLHALYNFGLFASGDNQLYLLMSVVITLVVNGGLFWLFYKATETDVALGIAHGHDAEIALYNSQHPLPQSVAQE